MSTAQQPRTRIAYGGRSVDTMPMRVAVAVVHSRGANPWVLQALDSVKAQSYANTELVVLDNNDHALTIGAAYNELARFTTAPLVLYLSDDDLLSIDLVASMVAAWEYGRSSNPDLVHCTTNCTAYMDQYGTMVATPLAHLGMFDRAWLLENPFDETLPKGVAQDMHSRLQRRSELARKVYSQTITHHYGYIYRQHVGMAGGMRIVAKPQMQAVR